MTVLEGQRHAQHRAAAGSRLQIEGAAERLRAFPDPHQAESGLRAGGCDVEPATVVGDDDFDEGPRMIDADTRVTRAGDPATVHVAHIGPRLERHEAFPEHTNVEFAYVHDGVIHARVWERGVGETMACGSGACAVLVAANEAGLVPSRAVVSFPGGDLEVERRDDGQVLLTGDAVRVFEGSVDLTALVRS